MTLEQANNLVDFLVEEQKFIEFWQNITDNVEPNVFIPDAIKKLDPFVFQKSLDAQLEGFPSSTVFLLGFLIGAKTQQAIKEKV